MTEDSLRERMRREAHEALDERLDRRERWRYPLVETIVVESPLVRKLREQEGASDV